MTSRERVAAALNHQDPDRIPIDFGGHRSSGIMALAYVKLRDYLGLPKRLVKVYDFIQQLAVVDDDVHGRFPTDVVDAARPFYLDDAGWKEWTLPGGTPCLIPDYIDVRLEGGDWYIYNKFGLKCAVMRKSSIYFDQVYWPYEEEIPAGVPDFGDAFVAQMWAAAPPPPAGIAPEKLAERLRAFREKTDLALNFIFGGNLYEPSTFMCTIPNAMMWMLIEPERYAELLDALLDMHMRNIDTIVRAVAPHIDTILFGDDFGMGTGPQFSLELYRKYFEPREARMWSRVKEIAPGLKIQLHSCGGIAPLIPYLAEAGLDACNPVQTNCAGMEPEELKGRLGKLMSFWGGGCDTAFVLPRATPGEVREHVLERCRIFSADGGFIFQQVHNIMADVPPENIAAMFDAVKEFNEKYR